MDSLIEKQNLFVAIAGNIGSGKTTLTQKLANHLGWRPHFESVQNNPYLADFYLDMSRWSFPLQIYFLTHRFNTHRQIEKSPYPEVQDRSIYEDAHVFARALFEQEHMSERDYENYLTLYHSMVKFLGAPTLVIYLRRSVPKLLERIRHRARDCEKGLNADYLTRLNYYYEEWYESYTLGHKILIETDDLDLLHNEDHFGDLLHQVQLHTQQKNCIPQFY